MEKDIWKDLGNIENISKRYSGSYWVYNKKMYVLGGMAWEYTDKKYLYIMNDFNFKEEMENAYVIDCNLVVIYIKFKFY